MNWFRKMIFVDPEPSKDNPRVQKKEVQTPPSQPITSSQPRLNVEVLPVDSESIEGKIDSVLIQKLSEVMDKNAVDGIDYLKFRKSVDSLRELQPDENIRFSTAYITLKATNPSLTKDSLTKTIDHYIDLIEQERKSGMKELDALRSQNIDKKEQEINKAIQEVEKMKVEIQKLTTFITETNNEIVEKKNDYGARQANFNTTVDKMVNQLKEDKTKIETLIK